MYGVDPKVFMTIQIKAVQQYFHLVLFNVKQGGVDEILKLNTTYFVHISIFNKVELIHIFGVTWSRPDTIH